MTKTQNEYAKLRRSVARVNATVLAIVFSLVGGIGLFLTTAWLLIKGGENIGSHLRLLGNYFIGYSVTWQGSLVGLFYGTIAGGIIGWTIGIIYNKIVNFRQR